MGIGVKLRLGVLGTMSLMLSACANVPFLATTSLFDKEVRVSPPPGYCPVDGPASQSEQHAMIAYTPCFENGAAIITVTARRLDDPVTITPNQLGSSVNGTVARLKHPGKPRPFDDASYIYRTWTQSGNYGFITTYYAPDGQATEARNTLRAFHRNLLNAHGAR